MQIEPSELTEMLRDARHEGRCSVDRVVPSQGCAGNETRLPQSLSVPSAVWDKLLDKANEWREKATKSREEAGRIRRTINEATDAEMRCNVRAEVWDWCADELRAAIDKAKAGVTVPK